MRNYCTYADSNYRLKLLAMHSSLIKHNPDSWLYILCLDNSLYSLLSRLALEQVTLIRLEDFLDPALASKKGTRTYREWIWTMTPSLPLYIYEHWHPEEIAHVDSDLFFFSSLEPMYEEIGDAEIMVIPHRFPPGKNKSENGKYNVSLVWFRLTEKSLHVLREWRVQCLDWCHCWPSQGRFADQGYLNPWPEKYGAHVLEHLGCNLAPWNMGQYEYHIKDGPVALCLPEPHRCYNLIFFHFHEFAVNNEFTADFFRGHYARTPFIERHIYAPYEAALREQVERIRNHVGHTR